MRETGPVRLGRLDECPLLSDWIKPQIERLFASQQDESENWLRLCALLGILNTRFYSTELDIPKGWIKDREYVCSTYSLDDVSNLEISVKELREWSEYYDNPDKAYFEGGRNPWKLQENLANELVELFFQAVRKLATSTGRKSSVADVVKRDENLRLLVNEARLYDSLALANSFYRKLEVFLKEFEGVKDPTLQHTLLMLRRMFLSGAPMPKFEFLTGTFAKYFESLESKVKPDDIRTVQVLKSEVENYLIDLLRENKRLARKVAEFEGE